MLLNVASVLATVLVGSGWPGHGGNAQHTGLSSVASTSFGRIAWSTPIDLVPRYFGSSLLTHYGSPCITAENTAIVPVKQNLDSGFNVNAFRGSDGTPVWSATTDYIMPPHSWTPSFGPCLIPGSRTIPHQTVAWPMAGGRVAFRDAETPSAPVTTVAFYGNGVYNANPSQYNANVCISTPLVPAPDGTVYFGFVVLGSTGAQLQSGLARVNVNGTGTWLSAASASADPSINRVKPNCTPAITEKGDFVYVTLSSGNMAKGCLAKVATKVLKAVARVTLMDPKANLPAGVDDDGTASPMIAPDGDVYVGVLENSLGSNHFRGWLLHYNGDLTQTKIPGAFGWDDTASIVPSSIVPNYHGSSPYLLVTKYNNYAGAGGTGQNKIGLLDPMVSAVESVSGIPTMAEVATIVGPTPDPDFIASHPLAVREWCVNTCAVDVPGKCVIINCEDGVLYKWDLTTFNLSESIRLTDGIGEAYTPTAIGADGGVYAISNARLYVIGSANH